MSDNPNTAKTGGGLMVGINFPEPIGVGGILSTVHALGPGNNDQDLYIDHPAAISGGTELVVLSSTNKFCADGHVDSSHYGHTLNSVAATTGTPSITATTWTIDDIEVTGSTIYGLQTLTVNSVYNDAVPGTTTLCVDAAVRNYVAMPQSLKVTISGATNLSGSPPCTSCTNANKDFTLAYDSASGTWTCTLATGLTICAWNKLIVSVTSAGAVQFWIRKPGMGTALVTYMLSNWNFSFPITVPYYSDNGICTGWPSSIQITT